MSEDTWYRNSNWSKKEQEYFWNKIDKSRSSYNKAQYVRIKALYLFESKNKKNILGAIQILKTMLKKWPEESELASAYLQLAEAYSEINEQESAIFNFEKCLSSEKKYPGYGTTVKTLYPRYIVENNLNHLYERALALVKEEKKEELLFPNQLFIISAVKAIIWNETGNFNQAKLEAEKAIEFSKQEKTDLRYHQKLGLFDRDENKTLCLRIQKIIKATNRESRLDYPINLMRSKKYFYKNWKKNFLYYSAFSLVIVIFDFSTKWQSGISYIVPGIYLIFCSLNLIYVGYNEEYVWHQVFWLKTVKLNWNSIKTVIYNGEYLILMNRKYDSDDYDKLFTKYNQLGSGKIVFPVQMDSDGEFLDNILKKTNKADKINLVEKDEESSEFVNYKGTEINKDWLKEIKKAQNEKYYKIDYKKYSRIRYGDEVDDGWESKKYPCHDCAVVRGEYHVPNCDVEECPKCREQAISCGCNYNDKEVEKV